MRSKGVLSYLLIAFGLAWAAVFVAHAVLGWSMADPVTQLTMALPMAFGPAIAAVVVRRWITREGFADAGLAPRLRAAKRYYLIAWLGPVLVLAVTVGLAAALGLYEPDLADLPGPAALLVLVAPVVLTPVFWGEEFGWRSYLQQRVGRSPARAALITGLVWAAWHYPLVLTDYASYASPLLGIVTWTSLIVAQAVILAWLFLRSGSVWVPCLAHAGNNMVIGTLSAALLTDAGGLDPAAADLLGLVPLAAICAWILLTGRLAPSTRESAEAKC
ncbi:CPBP family intramembrane metalloprotease [Plantactinospora sp. S1510]|uniref:CPBP family intramembrane metalloprotease n=1 Tax=Plantactinospora alkalitolerans TaxID=2789879 RepID=A0ABS0H4N4_9ACTN|nr:type II CAAX endopeptidase family protein [Plantactinospora alkalitolerans]MBF9133276.1 CPBP family intramembrane metalloprotease [Plantactinospora alkalitolerans]